MVVFPAFFPNKRRKLCFVINVLNNKKNYPAQSFGISPDFSQLGLRPRRLSIRRYSAQFRRIIVKCSRDEYITTKEKIAFYWLIVLVTMTTPTSSHVKDKNDAFTASGEDMIFR